jgi:hypothetical protein
MRKLLLIIALFVVTCSAAPWSVGFVQNAPPASGSAWYPTNFVANVGFFLNYHDLALGDVSSWQNEMPSADAYVPWTGTYSKPTNTGMGVFFYNSALTNNTYSNINNFSLWMVLAQGNDPTNYGQIIGAYAAGTTNWQFTNNGSTSALGAYYGARSSQAAPLMEFIGQTGDNIGSAGQIQQSNMWNDIIDAEGTAYWHAVSHGTFPTPTGNVNWQAIGNNNLAKGSPFKGYLKYLLISTNHAITATEATNLWVWEETNGVTNVSGGLVSWWKVADASNSLTIADSSGNGWNGNCINSPVYTNGLNSVVFGALNFNGTNQTVMIPITSSYFPSPGQGCTISAWVKYTSGGNASSFIMGYANVAQWVSGENVGAGLTAAQGFQLLQDGDANIRGEVNSTVGNETEGNTMAANDGNWHHMVFASDGTNVFSWFDDTRNYIGTLNGTQIGGIQSGTGWLTLMTNIQFSGSSVSTNYEPCTMTDVRIYNRILGDAEVDILYRAPTVDAIIGAYNY